jgi:Uma2 family endonuclease
MAAAPTLPLISVEEYLRTDYEIPCEYVDGVLVEKHGGKRTHGLLQLLLANLLAGRQEQHGVRIYIEQHIKIGPSRFRIPDVLIMPSDHKREEILTEPPICTFEVVSQTESWTELTAKYKDHHAMGVPMIVIADPYERAVFTVDNTGKLHEQPDPLVINVPMPAGGDLQIGFGQLFASLD